MPKRTPSDWIQEGFAIAALAAIFLIPAMHWSEMPARVPAHFGVFGLPDSWGGKSIVWLLPFLGLGLYILMTAAARYHSLINLPFTIDRNAPEVQGLLQSMLITLKMVVLFIFSYLERTQVNTALGRASGLGEFFLPVTVVAVVVPLGFYLQRLWKFRK